MLSTILIVVLILWVLGSAPVWSHSRNYGYYPSGIGGILLVVVLVMLLTGRI